MCPIKFVLYIFLLRWTNQSPNNTKRSVKDTLKRNKLVQRWITSRQLRLEQDHFFWTAKPAFSHFIGTLGLINFGLECLLWDNWFHFAFDEWLMPLGGEEAHDYRHRKNFKASLTIITNDKINMVKHTSSQAMGFGIISVCHYECLQQQIC